MPSDSSGFIGRSYIRYSRPKPSWVGDLSGVSIKGVASLKHGMRPAPPARSGDFVLRGQSLARRSMVHPPVVGATSSPPFTQSSAIMRFIDSADRLSWSLACLSVVCVAWISCSSALAAEPRSPHAKSTPKPPQRAQAVALRATPAKPTKAAAAPAPRPEEPNDGITRLLRVNGEWIRMPIVIREMEP